MVNLSDTFRFLSPQFNLDNSKKSQVTNTSSTNIQETNSYNDARSLSVVINSPNSSIATKTSASNSQSPKLEPELSLNPNFSAPSQSSGYASASPTSSNSLIPILLIGGLAVGGFFLLSKKK